MKKTESKGNGLLNTTNIVIGVFLLVVGVAIGLILNSNSSFALDTNNLKYGDLNCDGEVTSADMVTLARAVKKMITLTEAQRVVADVNSDGKVDKTDEYILAKYIVNYDSMNLPYTGTVSEIKYGDVNLDGSVTSADAVLLNKYLTDKSVELNDEQRINADVNLDGVINGCDKTLIGSYLVGEVTFPYITPESTPSDATPSDATSSNATSSNATSSNATASNATSSNASANDNILLMNSIGLKSSEAAPNDQVGVTLEVIGTCNSSTKIYFEDPTTEYRFGTEVIGLNTEAAHIIIPSGVPSGNYTITDVILIGLNSDNTTFTKHYSSVDNTADVFLDFIGDNKKIKVTRNTSVETNIVLGSVSLSKSTASVGEQVNLNIEHKENIHNLSLLFKSDNNRTFKVYLDRFNINYEGAYFTVPSNTVPDNYYLFQIAASNGGDTVFYTKGVNLNDIYLEVTSNEEETYIYSNVNFGENEIAKIYDAPDGSTIVIDANIVSIIREGAFEAIKGTSKKLIINYQGNQIVFYGKNISTPKTIDANISIDEDVSGFSDIVEDGVVVNLSSNGTLPGKATYKIYATDEMKALLGNRRIYLYYYDEVEHNFTLVQTNVKLNGNYYELEINHNSKFVLTKNKIDSQYVVKSSNNIIDFQNSDTINLLLVICGVALILIVVIIILLFKRKKK